MATYAKYMTANHKPQSRILVWLDVFQCFFNAGRLEQRASFPQTLSHGNRAAVAATFSPNLVNTVQSSRLLMTTFGFGFKINFNRSND